MIQGRVDRKEGRGGGATARVRWGGGQEGARGEGISQMDMMKYLGVMRLQFFLTLFTRATPGTPASTYIFWFKYDLG